MSNRTIEIVVDVRDATGGKLGNLKKQLDAMDAAAQRMANRIKAIGLQRFAATIRLIDRVTEPASRINNLLKKIAGGAYRITMRLNDAALAGIRKIESALMRLTSKAYNIAVNVKGAAASKLGGLMSGAAMGAGMFMPIAGAAGIGFGVANAITSSMAFEKQMSKVQAIRQLSKDSAEMQALTQQAKDLGMQTAWTRQQVGEAQYYQALAGWSTQQILKSTPHLLNLASAGGTDLGRTSDIVTDTMTAFELKATENYVNKQGKTVNATEHYIDMLAKLQASSNTDISQAGEALKYSANVIGKMFSGQSIQQRMQATEDTLIMTGLMANAGIKGSMAGTATRAIFSRMASGNRNAFWPLKGMGIEYMDKETGDLLLPGEIMRNISRKFKEGVDPNQLLDFAETIAGEKIHADTRRKLDSFIQQTQKNGGKMGSADMAKMAAMLAGQEAMSGLLAVLMGDWDAMADKLDNVGGTAKEMADTMLDNLAGSFTYLGSAWDAFQQDLFTGTAGDGLRGLVDTLTELVTRANNLFKDGIDIGDFGKIIGDVITRLKNKFLELDGVGSFLAGGALAVGLYKIISLSQRAVGALKGITKAGAAGVLGAGGAAGGLSAAQKVGTMTVSAGVGNVNGRVAGGVGGAGGVGARGAAGAAAALSPVALAQQNLAKARAQHEAAMVAAWGNPRGMALHNYQQAQKQLVQAEQALATARVNAYKEQIAQSKQSIALAREEAKVASATRMANIKSAGIGGAAFAGIFSLLDIMNVKSMNAERLAAATDENRAQIIRENRQAEWQAAGGGLGAVAGAAAGAALGSLAGPMGTTIGGIVGGMIGEKLGAILGEKGAEGEVIKSGTNRTVLDKEIDSYMKPDYSFGQKTSNQDFKEFAEPDLSWKGQITAAAHSATKEIKTLEQQLNADTEAWNANFKRQNAQAKNFTGQWRGNASSMELYRQLPEARWKMPDMTGAFDQTLGTLLSTVMPSFLPFHAMNLFPSSAGAAELTPEQRATEGQVAMPEITPPETSPLDEWFNFDGVTERLAELGAQITEGLGAAMEGAGELASELGTSISENLSMAMESAGELFNGFGEMVSSGLSAAQSAAEGALSTIQSAFTSAKESIQSAWGELPGFFSSVFSGLGGAASAAGSAIYSGLTSVIGSIIGAWQSAASTIAGIISSIASMAASAGSAAAGAIGGIGKAEGGFVTSTTHFFAGEHGPEAIIPLDPSKRSRALDLLAQTESIVNGASMNFGDEVLSGDSFPMSTGGTSSGGGSTTSFSIGGITVNFDISGAHSPEDVMQTIKENLQELSDKVMEQSAKAIVAVFQNRPLTA